MLGIFIVCLRVMGMAAFAGEVPVLEDANGNPRAGIGPGPTTYVYSGRDTSNVASQVGGVISGVPGVNVVAVADVRGLGWWPISRVVKDAVVEQGKRDGTSVLFDWTGAWGNAMGLQGGSCSVVVTDGKSVVLRSECGVILEGGVVVK
jgi:hypothetical protein